MLKSVIFFILALFMMGLGFGFMAAICVIISAVFFINKDDDDNFPFGDDDDKRLA